MMKPRLTIFDEPMLYTEGLSKLLMQSKIFTTINICNSLENLSKQLRDEPPEMLVISSNILMLSEICKSVESIITEHHHIKIIIIGSCYDVIDIRKLFNKGIKSYLDKNCRYDEFLKAINALLLNEIYICDHAKERMLSFISNEQEKRNFHIRDPLTRREMEILKLICDGFSSKDISEKLFISINTVETHRKKILLKLNVKNTAGVVKYAIENHIVD
ncbi:two component transcriptional regulator, LuxR family [Chryseobacterium sp. StRB126]|uniref:response regulator transcription factor n=1 Tax=Chryseobacterium sp. StRB126 TaxID=878220 RepID=UPI0004E994DB|nr:response regulator transcription factor [Chryseobacterium sp. StRB126]BAP30279.1 two component transcriptional regulator, LuxR family [Chryseobacterium sp. StRB126]